MIKLHNILIISLLIILCSCHGHSVEIASVTLANGNEKIEIKDVTKEENKNSNKAELTFPTSGSIEIFLPSQEDISVEGNTLPIENEEIADTTENEEETPILNSTPNKISKSNSQNPTEYPIYNGIMLESLGAREGSFEGKNLSQKSVEIISTSDGYNISIGLSDLFNQMYSDLNEVEDIEEFNEKYTYKFETKEDAEKYFKNYKEYLLDKYEFIGKEEKENETIYEYKSEMTPYKLYKKQREISPISSSVFERLQNKVELLKELEYLEENDENAQPLFIYKDEEYSLDELKEIENGKFSNLEYDGIKFTYKFGNEIVNYRSLELLKLSDPLNEISTDVNEVKLSEDIKVEEIKEAYLKLHFLGKGVGLSYADYGYWEEEVVNEEGELIKDYAIPFIGGLASKKIEEKDIKEDVVFKGKVIANIKELNKSSKSKSGEIEYRLGEEKEFKAKIKDWYEIEIRGGEESSDWKFKEGEGFKGDVLISGEEGKGKIREVEYYKGEEGLESVGILEYIDPHSTHLTLTYGAKK